MIITKLMPFIGIVIWFCLNLSLGKVIDGFFKPVGIDFSNPLQQDVLNDISAEEQAKGVAYATMILGHQEHFENILSNAQIQAQVSSPSWGQLIEERPHFAARSLFRDSIIAEEATQYFANSQCSEHPENKTKCIENLRRQKINPSTLIKTCQASKEHSHCTNQKYRNIDGACSGNSANIGKSFTAYKRLVAANYDDHISKPHGDAFNDKMPNARTVSSIIGKDINLVNPRVTLTFAQWGQFLEHDLAHTGFRRMYFLDKPIECCSADNLILPPREVHPYCMPIKFSRGDDPIYGKHWVDCINYVRSMTTVKNDCTFGPIEQMNQATHFLDGSQIYGVTNDDSKYLRTGTGGRLKSSEIQGGEFPLLSKQPNEDCHFWSKKNKDSVCFITGDSRVNGQPYITTMYTLWVREHNRVAQELEKLNPKWSDEELFQETRRIVISEMQHITFDHWLPLLLGKDAGYRIGVDKFSNRIDASISNSFATAAIRFIYSMMDSFISLKSNSSIVSKVPLSDHYHRPNLITQPGNMEALLRGLTSNNCQQSDLSLSKELTSKLYKTENIGYDIFSLDIQRGRDHGLASYNTFRAFCGLPKAENWDDLTDVISKANVEMFKKVYKNVNDVELIVGGLAESSSDNGLLGPTFKCLFTEQMQRTKIGDRFFYSHVNTPNPLQMEQIAEINKVTLARIICDNTEMDQIQRNVFEKESENNEKVRCDDPRIPRMSLNAWAEKNH